MRDNLLLIDRDWRVAVADRTDEDGESRREDIACPERMSVDLLYQPLDPDRIVK